MSPAGFEPTIQAGERPKTYVLDRAATGIGDQKGMEGGKEDVSSYSMILKKREVTGNWTRKQ